MTKLYIKCNIFNEIPSLLNDIKCSSFIILTDNNVSEYYSKLLYNLLNNYYNNNKLIYLYIIPAGERYKTRKTKELVENYMLENKLTRDTFLLTLGGGVVGDLGGYVASTYLRSINYAHIPTSLLAMVDSSIGGKTGVDTFHGKNLIGAFYQPYAIFIDPLLLKTLPLRHLCNGMAEVIKTAAIYDDELFKILMKSSKQILSYDTNILEEIVKRTANIKVKVTSEDTKELGIRAILNFGHSIGHAIEAVMMPKLLHGECVSIGMIAEAELSYNMKYLPSWTYVHQLQKCCELYQLPIKLPIECRGKINYLMEKLSMDKKNRNGQCKIVMLTSIGTVYSNPYTITVPIEKIRQTLCTQVSLNSNNILLNGKIQVPGSKSISNRVLLLAALGEGECCIENLLHSHDTEVMINALIKLGVKCNIIGDNVIINGSCGELTANSSNLYLGNAGTATRFLTTMCNLVQPSENNDYIILNGDNRMHERPIKDLVTALNNNGCNIIYYGQSKECPPLKISCKNSCLKGGEIILAANISSQYVSSILMSAPYALEPVILKLLPGNIVSQVYIDMTLKIMADFGIKVKIISSHEYHIPKACYKNPSIYAVEGDASASTYPLAMAAITGKSITITNVGKTSSQGDAEFCYLLEKMGCIIEQNEYETTVHGNKNKRLNALGNIDMSRMTDAFLTLACVAAVANGTTTITNIANQRVKECNRIEAMVNELSKCGVEVYETKDGLSIVGNEFNNNNIPIVINCYNDHRIAMSFAILSLYSSNIIIDDKYCVSKTYPQFWAQINRDLNINTIGQDVNNDINLDYHYIDSPSIFIIGMRGSGKSTLGKCAAMYLGKKLIDIDTEIEKVLGCTIKEFVNTKKNGWQLFRQTEFECLQRIAYENPLNCIIVCGGGIVETPNAIKLLKQQKIVVEIRRDIDDICNYLTKNDDRPQFNDSIRSTYIHRRPLFDQCATCEFKLLKNDQANVNIVGKEFTLFLCRLLNVSYISHGHHKRKSLNDNTFFLSLTLPNVSMYENIMNDLCIGIDVLELRVDLLKSYDEDYIREQCAILRRLSDLPIIFTIRSESQGGKFPNDEILIFKLLKLGMHLGVSYIDIESHWSHKYIQSLFEYRTLCHLSCEFIISTHIPNGNGGEMHQLFNLFNQCYMDGMADIVKVVISAKTQNDAIRLINCAEMWQDELKIMCPSENVPRIIVLAMGSAGQVSRVLNRILTPVTHELLPKAAAPGQMSVKDIMLARNMIGLTPKRNFYLFGDPISLSPSPIMHNAGFKQLGIHDSYVYSLQPTIDVEYVKNICKNESFTGASVTIPLKEKVISFVDILSISAKKIGAVNTLYRQLDGNLYGDNTDWLGIVYPLIPLLFQHNIDCIHSNALVIGAGGTARAALFALNHLGYNNKRLNVYNPRTIEKGILLAKEFNGIGVSSLVEKKYAIIICTLPGNVGYELPNDLMITKPIIVDVSYLPVQTALSQQANKCQCSIIRGIDMLVAQGIAAFDIWTNGRCFAAHKHMDNAAREYYKTLQ